MKNIVTTALVLAGITFGINTSANAGDHIDDVAFSLQKQVQVLHYEFARNYIHTPSYRHLMSDTTQMYRLAAHIHDVAHNGGNVRHLESDVRQLDKLFHHIEGLVNSMDRPVQHGHLAPLHGHGHHGHFQCPNRRRARMLMVSVEQTIHHLHDDLQEIIRAQQQISVPVYRPAPVYNPGPVYRPTPVFNVQPRRVQVQVRPSCRNARR